MVVWTILGNFGPVHFPTVPRPFPNGSLKRRPLSISLVAPYRAILRYHRCDTPYRTILLQGSRLTAPQDGAITLPWCLVSHRHICGAMPHCATYRDSCATRPQKQAPNSFVILSLQAFRACQNGDSKREKPDPERTFSQIFADFR